MKFLEKLGKYFYNIRGLLKYENDFRIIFP